MGSCKASLGHAKRVARRRRRWRRHLALLTAVTGHQSTRVNRKSPSLHSLALFFIDNHRLDGLDVRGAVGDVLRQTTWLVDDHALVLQVAPLLGLTIVQSRIVQRQASQLGLQRRIQTHGARMNLFAGHRLALVDDRRIWVSDDLTHVWLLINGARVGLIETRVNLLRCFE